MLITPWGPVRNPVLLIHQVPSGWMYAQTPSATSCVSGRPGASMSLVRLLITDPLAACRPLPAQDGVQQIIGPLALGPGALPQVALAGHGEPLEPRGRGQVARVADGRDPVLAERPEQVAEQQPGRLGGVPPSLEGRRDREPDLGLPRLARVR